jgi:hypothetical protein
MTKYIMLRKLSEEEIREMKVEKDKLGCPDWETYVRALRAVYRSAPSVQDNK